MGQSMGQSMGKQAPADIVVNGKFLGAQLNGVHRTAAYYSRELMKRAAGKKSLRLLAPPGAEQSSDFPMLAAEHVAGRFGRGQGWEMLTLPTAARGSLLVNFCNLAPVLHPNSVVMIHDAQTFLFPDDYTGKQAFFYRALLPLIGRRARRILTVSHFSRQSLADQGIGTLDKIEVVHNGTDHILDTPADSAILQRHGLAPGGYVLLLGSAKGYKNMRVVFDAMREPLASGLPLVVAGGPGLQAYLDKGWTPPANATFTGFVSDGELRALYEHAALFAFPSLTEGFGLPPVEAMHCGTPVVAANAGAMPEVLGKAAILVDNDPAEYRRAIESVLGDQELSGSLRNTGLLRAGELSWSAAGDRLYSIIAPLTVSGTVNGGEERPS